MRDTWRAILISGNKACIVAGRDERQNKGGFLKKKSKRVPRAVHYCQCSLSCPAIYPGDLI